MSQLCAVPPVFRFVIIAAIIAFIAESVNPRTCRSMIFISSVNDEPALFSFEIISVYSVHCHVHKKKSKRGNREDGEKETTVAVGKKK